MLVKSDSKNKETVDIRDIFAIDTIGIFVIIAASKVMSAIVGPTRIPIIVPDRKFLETSLFHTKGLAVPKYNAVETLEPIMPPIAPPWAITWGTIESNIGNSLKVLSAFCRNIPDVIPIDMQIRSMGVL